MSPLRTALLALPLALAGCGGDTARTLGFTRDAPDEFQVTTRAPLSVPPRLGDLPVPTPGAPRPQEQRTTAGLVSPAASSAAAPSAAERALIARAGGPVDGDIRRQVDMESLRLDRPPPDALERMMFWQQPRQSPGIAVDATREAQRLREAAALGREPTDGQTPIVQPRQRTWFQELLGL